MSWAEIGKALNSTVKDPEKFMPLDLLIQYRIDIQNKKNIYTRGTAGTEQVYVPIWATKAKITACAGGGGGGFKEAKIYAGGGGGDAILDKEVEVDEGLRNSYISVTVGYGGSGAYLSYDESNDTYVPHSPTKGGNTTISAFRISLIGGGAGEKNTGGAAGGTGGGKGGDGAMSYSAVSKDGSPGISGSGGTGSTNGQYQLGGGGGSLGSGGSANASGTNSTDNSSCKGSKGGGGGAFSSTSNSASGGSGGTGYVKIEWLL